MADLKWNDPFAFTRDEMFRFNVSESDFFGLFAGIIITLTFPLSEVTDTEFISITTDMIHSSQECVSRK